MSAAAVAPEWASVGVTGMTAHADDRASTLRSRRSPTSSGGSWRWVDAAPVQVAPLCRVPLPHSSVRWNDRRNRRWRLGLGRSSPSRCSHPVGVCHASGRIDRPRSSSWLSAARSSFSSHTAPKAPTGNYAGMLLAGGVFAVRIAAWGAPPARPRHRGRCQRPDRAHQKPKPSPRCWSIRSNGSSTRVGQEIATRRLTVLGRSGTPRIRRSVGVMVRRAWPGWS